MSDHKEDVRRPTPRPRLAVIDIDGVLADVRHRLHHLEGRRRDWSAFFDAATEDEPMAEGRAQIAEALNDGLDVVYLTGRPERCRQSTESWLSEHGFPAAPLHMRPEHDRRPARAFKVEALRELSRSADIARVIDDDAAVVEAIAQAGFVTVHATWMADTPTLTRAQEDLGRT